MAQKQDLRDFIHSHSSGTITAKTIEKFLYSDRQTGRVKSEVNLPAQSTNLCVPGNSHKVDFNQILLNIEKIKNYNNIVYYVANIQFELGLRVSEVLSISFSDILPSGHFYLKGSKGSKNRVYFCTATSSYFSKCAQSGCEPFSGYNRYFIYRTYKKFGINFQFQGSKKQSVTHAFRHAVANEIYNNSKDMETVGDFLRHKSKNSTKYYVDGKKEKK